MTNLEKYNAALKVMKDESAAFIQECYPDGPEQKLSVIRLQLSSFKPLPIISYELYYHFPYFECDENRPTDKQLGNIEEYVEYMMLSKVDIRMKFKIVHEGYIYKGTCSPEVKEPQC